MQRESGFVNINEEGNGEIVITFCRYYVISSWGRDSFGFGPGTWEVIIA
jgi:hypothetical protein